MSGVSRHKAAQLRTLPQPSVNFYFDMCRDVAGGGAAPPLKTAKPKSCVNYVNAVQCSTTTCRVISDH